VASKKRVLILSGGGVHAATTLVTLKNFWDDHVDIDGFDVIAGTSAGAINAAFLASVPKEKQYEELEKLIETWTNLTDEDIYCKSWSTIFAIGLRGYAYTLDPLECLLHERLGDEFCVPCYIGITDITDGHYFELRMLKNNTALSRRTNINALIASCSYPILFPAKKIGPNLYADGGIIQQIPTGFLGEHGKFDEMVVAIPRPPFRKNSLDKHAASNNSFTNLARVIEIAAVGHLDRNMFHLNAIKRKHVGSSRQE
jgi:predicted acylesterase/phospholipase RssA